MTDEVCSFPFSCTCWHCLGNPQPPKRGDRYDWNGVICEVMRVGRKGDFADLKVRPPTGPHWSKRQRLPFPDDFRKVTP